MVHGALIYSFFIRVHVPQENKLQLQHWHSETSIRREVTGKVCWVKRPYRCKRLSVLYWFLEVSNDVTFI